MPDDKQCTNTADTGFTTVRCGLGQGHGDQHNANGYVWFDTVRREVRDPSVEQQLTGRRHDDLFYELFSRLAALEQGRYADGPATDDLFSAHARDLRALDERMTRLEEAFRPALPRRDRDLSALRAALYELTEVVIARTSETNRLLERIADSVAPIVEPMCGEPDHISQLMCELVAGHEGRHAAGISSWPVRCAEPHPDGSDRTCALPRGHRHDHSDSSALGHRWWHNDAEPVTHVEPGADYAERASGSPAPVRCVTQFREGQCLGYAGHDGECSAVPDSGSPTPEEPSESMESTYDRTSDDTLLSCRIHLRVAETGGEVRECFLVEGHEGMHEDGTGRKFKA